MSRAAQADDRYDSGSHCWRLDIEVQRFGATRAYDLAHPLHVGTARHPNHPPFTYSMIRRHGDNIYPGGVSVAADIFGMGTHTGTHIDGLGHFSVNGRVHGDLEVRERQSYADGLQVNSVHELPPFFGLAHLVDMPKLLGRDLTTADEIGDAELEGWFRDRPAPAAGSAVLIRTGWAKHQADYPRYVGVPDGLPGLILSGARWLTERGVRVVGSDTVALEKTPTSDLPVHVHLIVESGVPIMESLNLEAISEDGHYDFLLVVIPMPIRGGTGSPVRPIALVSDT